MRKMRVGQYSLRLTIISGSDPRIATKKYSFSSDKHLGKLHHQNHQRSGGGNQCQAVKAVFWT